MLKIFFYLMICSLIVSCGDTFKVNKNSGATNQQLNQEIIFNPTPLSVENQNSLSAICNALETKMLYKINEYSDSKFNYFVRAQECSEPAHIGNFIKNISPTAYAFTGIDNGLGLATYTGMTMMEQSKDNGMIAIFCEHRDRSMISTSPSIFKTVQFTTCPMTNALCYNVVTATKRDNGKYYQSRIDQMAISNLEATKGFVKERSTVGSCPESGSFTINEKLVNIVKQNGSSVIP